jgi:hypothetical protein
MVPPVGCWFTVAVWMEFCSLSFPDQGPSKQIKGTHFETSFGDLPCRSASSPKKEMRCDVDLRTTFEGSHAVSVEGDLD